MQVANSAQQWLLIWAVVGLLLGGCSKTARVGPHTPPVATCLGLAEQTACGVPAFSPRIQASSGRVLVGASGLALIGDYLYTVLEAKGVGAGIEIPSPEALAQLGEISPGVRPQAVVHGVLFRTPVARPSSWQPIPIALSTSCRTLITTLAGDHRRRDLELESLDLRRNADGTIDLAVGSDFGYVATGRLILAPGTGIGPVAHLSRCRASVRELPNNQAFEAVTWADASSAAVIAFEEKTAPRARTS